MRVLTLRWGLVRCCLFAVCLFSATIAVGDDIPQAVKRFYSGQSFCATGSVDQLLLTPTQDVMVYLNIDDRWSRTLGTKDGVLRKRWFGLHCPIRGASVWRGLDRQQDIVVVAELSELGEYQLSCRHFVNQPI